MEIHTERVLSRLKELYQCGLQEDGSYSRMAYSPEDRKGREVFKEYFRKLGIETVMDAAGNLIARMEGENPDFPAIMVGSHLDTVPDGGKYDGVLGCVAGLEVCEAIKASGQRLKHPLEVVVFTDEEGFRFGSGLLGSSAVCGQELEITGTDEDMYGQQRADVMRECGIDIDKVSEAERKKDSVHCFLELHVEQGASLYKSKTPIGVVSSIAGVSRYEIEIQGEANHAGSTVMSDRKDALVAASRFIAEVPHIVAQHGNPFTVATVGTIKAVPNSVNVIPGVCNFQLEIRDQSEEILEQIERKLREYLDQVCKEKKEEYSFRRFSYHEPAPMADWVKETIEKSVQKLGIDYAVIPSGAFHDSLIMTSRFPTGMIFVPSVDGISHSRHEYTAADDIEKGLQVLLQSVKAVDNMIISC